MTEITLERDGHDQPWGFRLQGGKDVDAPLSVQRILVGTPADGFLKRGDIILMIGTTDVKNLSHQKAADLFACCTGNTITVSVKREQKPSYAKSTSITGQNGKSIKIISRTTFTTVGTQKAVKTYNYMQGWLPDKQCSPSSNQLYKKTHFPPTDSNSVKGNSFIQSSMDNQLSSPLPKYQGYNSPINLYSNQNVAEVTRLNQMGQSPIPSMNRAITPNKPQQVLLSPSKDYNPKDSATWQALQESTDSGKITMPHIPDPPNLDEHDPIYAAVYAAPKHPQYGGDCKPNPSHVNERVERAPVSPIPNPLSPRPISATPTIKLPPSVFTQASQPAMNDGNYVVTNEQPRTLTPRSAASDRDVLPIYETNSIGGRKKITQSATFNKLMMDVLGL